MADRIDACKELSDRLEMEIEPDPPQLVNKGHVIRSGVDEELDRMRDIAYNGKDYLLKIQERETEETGISSLKSATTMCSDIISK